MAITRYYEATIYIECCKSGEPVYIPDAIKVRGKVTKPRFESTLIEWGDKVHDKLDNERRPRAQTQCRAVGTRRLCKFNVQVNRWETGKPEVPSYLLDDAERYETNIETANERIKNTQDKLNKATSPETINRLTQEIEYWNDFKENAQENLDKIIKELKEEYDYDY